MYDRACSLCDSTAGDDLPGLLTNWGVGLHTIAELQGDPEGKPLLQEAIQCFQDAREFHRRDAALFNALGDALALSAEWAEPDAGLALLGRALREGYEVALQIDSNDMDALIGRAEVALSAGRLLQRISGRAADAVANFQSAAATYDLALRHAERIRGFNARAAVIYNAACACALGGNAAAARALIDAWVARGGGTLEEARKDPDLAGLFTG